MDYNQIIKSAIATAKALDAYVRETGQYNSDGITQLMFVDNEVAYYNSEKDAYGSIDFGNKISVDVRNLEQVSVKLIANQKAMEAAERLIIQLQEFLYKNEEVLEALKKQEV